MLGGGLPNLGSMGIDQQTLLAAVMGQNGGSNGYGNVSNVSTSGMNVGMVSRAMTPTMGEGRRSMESVPENGTMGEDYGAGNERLLRQILEDSVALENGQENNVPMHVSGQGDMVPGAGGKLQAINADESRASWESLQSPLALLNLDNRPPQTASYNF
eukprot:TRINITY_DN4327_c2_g2_i1.p4 TRINITY_DN4327_c2_g2~~TRINITY_DN4327_c2_g2_i1.p4  ORF type:complete len:158 (-),score=42.78 TRINITY_DN4327_c2_g2_i1:729-1202(-)